MQQNELILFSTKCALTVWWTHVQYECWLTPLICRTLFHSHFNLNVMRRRWASRRLFHSIHYRILKILEAFNVTFEINKCWNLLHRREHSSGALSHKRAFLSSNLKLISSLHKHLRFARETQLSNVLWSNSLLRFCFHTNNLIWWM